MQAKNKTKIIRKEKKEEDFQYSKLFIFISGQFYIS